jgi:hypothetical protein
MPLDDSDSFIRARVICDKLGKICRRTLYEKIKRGDFPKPDRPAQKRGEPDLWLLSTAERGITEYAKGRPSSDTHAALATK